jgi:hypothetical protein
MISFWISIAVLSLLQAATVYLAGTLPALAGLSGRAWAAVPAGSLVVFAVAAGVFARPSAQALTYLALVCVPVLAAGCVGFICPGARIYAIALVPLLFVLAWTDRNQLAGEGAACLLSAFSCATLGTLLAAVTPPRWLAAGIILMAVIDSALVLSNLLGAPNEALNAAHPVASLPRLQDANFGSAVIGYGDLFAAGSLGGLLARGGAPSARLEATVLLGALALGFDLLFLLVDELPATVPVAVTLLVLAQRDRRQRRRADTERSYSERRALAVRFKPGRSRLAAAPHRRR